MSRHHRKHLPWRRWARVRRAVFECANWRCANCGRTGCLEADHIQPLHKDGDPWDPANLQALCRSCHIEKTKAENRREPTAAERAWRDLVDDLMCVK